MNREEALKLWDELYLKEEIAYDYASHPMKRDLFEDSSWLAIRPSGTEPKCKFYLEVFQKEEKGIEEVAKGMMNSLKEQLHLK